MKASFAAVLFLISCSMFAAPGSVVHAGKKPWSERDVAVKNFKGRITLTPLGDGKIEIRMRTWRTSRDTVSGESIFPLLVNGGKEPFYCGHFGASRLPML